MLSSAQHINLRRIVREAIANAIRHAQPENMIIKLEIEKSILSLNISHNGTISDPAGWVSNRGLNNIKSRVAEMHGSHKWQIEQRGAAGQYCKLTVKVPLSISEHREHSVN
jgi:signal transduction histidine kinase